MIFLLRKKGVTYDDAAEPCNHDGGLINKLEKLLWDETCYHIYEVGSFNIDAIHIWVNGKHMAYSPANLGISLDCNQNTWSGHIQNNEKWIQLMLDDTCNVTN